MPNITSGRCPVPAKPARRSPVRTSAKRASRRSRLRLVASMPSIMSMLGNPFCAVAVSSGVVDLALLSLADR